MPTFYASLHVSFGHFGPDRIDAPDPHAAVLIARRELLGALDPGLLQTTGPRQWRIVIRDEEHQVVADVPALGRSLG